MSSSGKGKEKKSKKRKLSGYQYSALRDEKERGEIAKKMPKITTFLKKGETIYNCI